MTADNKQNKNSKDYLIAHPDFMHMVQGLGGFFAYAVNDIFTSGIKGSTLTKFKELDVPIEQWYDLEQATITAIRYIDDYDIDVSIHHCFTISNNQKKKLKIWLNNKIIEYQYFKIKNDITPIWEVKKWTTSADKQAKEIVELPYFYELLLTYYFGLSSYTPLSFYSIAHKLEFECDEVWVKFILAALISKFTDYPYSIKVFLDNAKRKDFDPDILRKDSGFL